MKKIFSFVAAALLATSAMFAGENLFNPATTTLETWFGDANWQTETLSTGVYDAETGVTTVNIAQAKDGQWKAQVKLHTDLTELDATKQYDFAVTLSSNVAFGGVTVKVFDNAEIFYRNDVQLNANENVVVSGANLSGVTSNGIIVFDFGYAPEGAEINISGISLTESEEYLYNCAEAMALDNGTQFKMKSFQVVYAVGKYTYIKDNSGSHLIYNNAGEYGLGAGNVVADGFEGEISIYKNLVEIKPISAKADLDITEGAEPAIPAATEVPSLNNMNQVVVYKRVSFAENVSINSSAKNATGIWGDNDEQIAFYNQFGMEFDFDATKEYNITAANSVYNNNLQAYLLEIAEYVAPTVDPDTVDHGLYNPDEADIPRTYFADPSWAIDVESTAEIIDGQIFIHLVQEKADRWQSQIFLNPGFEWTGHKYYRMEFDLYTNNQLGGVTIKAPDSDSEVWYESYPNDNIFLADQDTHYVADSIAVLGEEEGLNNLIVFAIGWCPAGTEVRIHNIRIVEIGDYEPEEIHLYIKHPWGTGADADWTWQEMELYEYGVYDAFMYEGKWGGIGCNINIEPEDATAKWYPESAMQFLNTEDMVVAAPAVGTDVMFVYVPDLAESTVTSAVKVIVYGETAVDNVNAAAPAQKMLRDGQVVIRRDGVEYNTLGAEIK